MTTENSSQGSSSSSSSSGDASASSSGSSTPAASASPAVDTSSQTSTPAVDSGSGDGQAQAAAVAAYQANYKFKAFGKEHEIEELYRPLMKDKDTEEKIRKFHEKAYAMEKMQDERNKSRTEFEQFKTQTEPNMRAMNHFNNLLKNKDWDNFFSGLGIPDEEIFNHVQKKLDLMKLPADQQAEIQRASQLRKEKYFMENQLATQTEQYQAQAVETRSMQLDTILSRQEVAKSAESFDNAYGTIGAFRDAVIEEGANHFHRTGQDLTAEQAANLVLKKFGKFLQTPGQGPALSAVQAAPAQASQGGGTNGNPPIIPHVAGSGKSPVKKSIRSLDDLKKLAKGLSA